MVRAGGMGLVWQVTVNIRSLQILKYLGSRLLKKKVYQSLVYIGSTIFREIYYILQSLPDQEQLLGYLKASSILTFLTARLTISKAQ